VTYLSEPMRSERELVYRGGVSPLIGTSEIRMRRPPSLEGFSSQ